MVNKLTSAAIAASVFVVASAAATSGASAACIYSEWINTMANHAIASMTGRDCNGVLALNAIGQDAQGNTFDFGWTPMQITAPGSFAATFAGAEATNDVIMTVHASDKTMNTKIITTTNDGQVTEWFAHFRLDSIH